MTEFQLYDKDGLFHNIVKQSAILNGRYAVLPKGAHDLNLNNLLSSLDLPKDKFPGAFLLPPVSELPATVQQGAWETFNFRILFLCTTSYTGDNKIKKRDQNTNSSLHTISMDWNDMKGMALEFMNALEKIQRKVISQFRLAQRGDWRIIRISGVQNDNVSGVMIMFQGAIATTCTFSDININAIQIPVADHTKHFH